MRRRSCLAMATGFAVGVAALGGASLASAADAPEVVISEGRAFSERTGEALYGAICQGCHMPQGEGAVGAGAYPALAGNARLAAPAYPVLLVLNGRKAMPAFGADLDDAQIAAVARFVRTRFANRPDGALTAADVAALRATTGARHER